MNTISLVELKGHAGTQLGIACAIADAFTRKVEQEVGRIQAAAQATQQPRLAYQAARGVNQAAIMALVVSMALAVVSGALSWYVPSRADIEADHAEEQRLEGVIWMLKEHGGLAQVQCGTHLCVRTDEVSRRRRWRAPPKATRIG